MPFSNDLISDIVTKSPQEHERDRVLRLALKLPPFMIEWGIAAAKMFSSFSRTKRHHSPDTLFFFVTNKCNEKCVHCFYGSELNVAVEGISLESIQKLCRSLRGRTPTVFLCGGEPTLRPDLPEIAKAFIDIAQVDRLFITSNGVLQKNLLATVDAAMSSPRKFQLRIPISLDGPQEIHDTIRQFPGGYDKAISSLQALISRSKTEPRLIPLTTTVLQKSNADVFLEFYKHLRTTYACQVQFTLIRQDDRDAGGLEKGILMDAGNPQDLLPPLDVCRKILKDVSLYEKSQPGFSYVPLLRSAFLEEHLSIVESKGPSAPCVAPESFATVYPNGGVSLCEVARPYANLKDFNYDLLSCWNSPAANDQRQKLSACWCTYPCALVNSIMRSPKALNRSLERVRQY